VRWLVTGAGGMLGHDLVATLDASDHEVIAAGRTELDIADEGSVSAFFDATPAFEVVVNCAAWTAVDDAETHEPEAFRVNATGARLVASAARRTGARVVQPSTDYVFEGSATTPYDEAAPPSPVSAYGRTKWAGEQAVREEHPNGHLVVRTAWLYGAHGACFPRTIARLARERGSVTVVADQVGQPTWTADLAELVVRLVEAGVPAGTYHGTASGQTSWFGFARAVVSSLGLDRTVVSPTASASFPRPAPRPAYSALGHDALTRVGVTPIADWRDRWQAAAAAVLSPGG
jgi:dTDP-4-dehydrorhamnose reductase